MCTALVPEFLEPLFLVMIDLETLDSLDMCFVPRTCT